MVAGRPGTLYGAISSVCDLTLQHGDKTMIRPNLAFYVSWSPCSGPTVSRPQACAQSLGEMPRIASRSRSFWVEPCTQEVLTAALEGGVEDFLFRNEADAERWDHLGRFSAHIVDTEGHFEGGVLRRVGNATEADEVATLAGERTIVILDAVDWRVIPAENVLAAYAGTSTQLYTVVADAEAARAMLGVLETGVDGVVLRSSRALDVRDFLRLRDEDVNGVVGGAAPTYAAQVKTIAHGGIGDRVCVDTTALLSADEGILVGSSSQCLFVVLSEAAQCDYIAPRAFRINAGAVHSYVAVPGGRTRYLAELCGGDEVLVYNVNTGAFRTVVVGRSKVETRPLTMITVTVGDDNIEQTLFVQNAETVRLATVDPNGGVAMKSVTQLREGEQLLVRTDSVARHTGIAIEESILEK